MAQFDLFRPSKRSWNRGRIVGAKPPLKPKHIWGIRQQLKSSNRVRDLALFNCVLMRSFVAATSSSCGSAISRPVASCASAPQ